MQSGLFPVDIIREMTPSKLTADLRCIGDGSDGHRYALKRLEDGPLLPATEWVCYTLCRLVGVPTPDFSAVRRVATGDVAFGSRWEISVDEVNPADETRGPVEAQVARLFSKSVAQQSAIFGVDAVVGNRDRHLVNFLFRKTAAGITPLAFDFSQAWVNLTGPFGELPWDKSSRSALTAAWLTSKGWLKPDQARTMVDRLMDLPDQTVENALESCDPSWISGYDWEPTLALWAQRKSRLKPLALQNFSAHP